MESQDVKIEKWTVRSGRASKAEMTHQYSSSSNCDEHRAGAVAAVIRLTHQKSISHERMKTCWMTDRTTAFLSLQNPRYPSWRRPHRSRGLCIKIPPAPVDRTHPPTRRRLREEVMEAAHRSDRSRRKIRLQLPRDAEVHVGVPVKRLRLRPGRKVQLQAAIAQAAGANAGPAIRGLLSSIKYHNIYLPTLGTPGRLWLPRRLVPSAVRF